MLLRRFVAAGTRCGARRIGSSRRTLPRVAALVVILAACAAPPAVSTPAPTRGPDIKRAKIDIAYTALVTASYAKPTSRELLAAALEAIRAEARGTGGGDIDEAPAFSERTEVVLDDFRRFAAAVEQLATRGSRVTPDRIADLAIESMVRLKPDCHTYYVKRPRSLAGGVELTARPPEAPAAVSERPRLTLLPGGVAVIAFRDFSFGILDDTRKVMDEALAQGAKAWIFDWRGNRGGYEARPMAMWFLDGGIMLKELDRTERPDLIEAKRELRLPERYQLPMAIVLDRGSFSAPEVVALALRDQGRATLVGQRSGGCLGSVQLFTLPDDHTLGVQTKEIVGGVTGLRANSVGLRPDIEVASGDPLAVAAEHLRKKLEGR